MTDLIVFLSEGGKPTWEHVHRIIEGQEWGTVYVLCNAQGRQYYKSSKKAQFIPLDKNKTISEIRDMIVNQLSGKITDFEVGVNMISGSGKEHTALLSALLKLGLGIRLVILTKEGIQDL